MGRIIKLQHLVLIDDYILRIGSIIADSLLFGAFPAISKSLKLRNC